MMNQVRFLPPFPVVELMRARVLVATQTQQVTLLQSRGLRLKTVTQAILDADLPLVAALLRLVAEYAV
jgi:hypothetical protein